MGRSKEKIDLSGTHLPVLAQLVTRTHGAILELGSGFNSTPLLYWHSKANKRLFMSFDNDKAWVDKLGGMTEYIEDWNDLKVEHMHWSIILVDQRPALERHRSAIKYKHNADFVVLHDSEPEIDKFYAYRRVWKHYKYRYDYTKIKPNTTVLSNYIDPYEIFR